MNAKLSLLWISFIFAFVIGAYLVSVTGPVVAPPLPPQVPMDRDLNKVPSIEDKYTPSQDFSISTKLALQARLPNLTDSISLPEYGTIAKSIFPNWDGAVTSTGDVQCLTQCDSIYTYCNPSYFSVPLSSFSAFDMSFSKPINDFSLKLKSSVPYIEYSSKSNVTCHTEKVEVTHVSNITGLNVTELEDKNVCGDTPIITQTQKTRMEYVTVNPYALSVPSGKCIDIRISGTKKPNERIQHLTTFNGKVYYNQSWWDSNWQYNSVLTPIGSNPLKQLSMTSISGWSKSQMQADCGDLRYLDPTETVQWPFSNLTCNNTDVVLELFNNGTSNTYLYWGNPSAADATPPSPISIGTSGANWEWNITGFTNGEKISIIYAKSIDPSTGLIGMQSMSANQTRDGYKSLAAPPATSQWQLIYAASTDCKRSSLVQTVDLPTRKMFNYTSGACQANVTLLAGLSGYVHYANTTNLPVTLPDIRTEQISAEGAAPSWTNFWFMGGAGLVSSTGASGPNTLDVNRPWTAFYNSTSYGYFAQLMTTGTPTQAQSETSGYGGLGLMYFKIPGNATHKTTVNVFGTNVTAEKAINDTFDKWKTIGTVTAGAAEQSATAPTIDSISLLPASPNYMNVTTCRANVTNGGENVVSVLFNVTLTTNSSTLVYGNGTTPFSGGTIGVNWTTGNFQPSATGTNAINCTVVAQGATKESAKTQLFSITEAAPSLIGSVAPASPFYKTQGNFVCNYTTGAGGSPANTKIAGATVYVNLDGYNRTATEETSGYTYTNSTAYIGNHDWYCLGYKTNYRALSMGTETVTIQNNPPVLNSISTSPTSPLFGQSINLIVNRSDDVAVTQVILNWTHPNATKTNYDNLTFTDGDPNVTAITFVIDRFQTYQYNVTVCDSSNLCVSSQSSFYVGSEDIRGCGTLNVANLTYILGADVDASATCFEIGADNVTLNGAGHVANYSKELTGYGIRNAGYDNFTAINMRIIYGNGALSDSYAIYAAGMEKSLIFNNTVVTSGPYGLGMFLYLNANSNTISENNITTYDPGGYGIYVYSSSSNNITGGHIISAQSYDYYLRDAGTANNFTNTGFNGQKRIYLYDTSSWFNYANSTASSIRLNTSVSAATGINRTLENWSQTPLKWTDKNETAGIKATYGIFGLLPSTAYNIFNNSHLTYTLMSSAGGILSPFTILLEEGGTAMNVTENAIPVIQDFYTLPASLNFSTSMNAIINRTDDVGTNQVAFNFTWPNGTVTNYGNMTFSNEDPNVTAVSWKLDNFGEYKLNATVCDVSKSCVSSQTTFNIIMNRSTTVQTSPVEVGSNITVRLNYTKDANFTTILGANTALTVYNHSASREILSANLPMVYIASLGLYQYNYTPTFNGTYLYNIKANVTSTTYGSYVNFNGTFDTTDTTNATFDSEISTGWYCFGTTKVRSGNDYTFSWSAHDNWAINVSASYCSYERPNASMTNASVSNSTGAYSCVVPVGTWAGVGNVTAYMVDYAGLTSSKRQLFDVWVYDSCSAVVTGEGGGVGGGAAYFPSFLTQAAEAVKCQNPIACTNSSQCCGGFECGVNATLGYGFCYRPAAPPDMGKVATYCESNNDCNALLECSNNVCVPAKNYVAMGAIAVGAMVLMQAKVRKRTAGKR